MNPIDVFTMARTGGTREGEREPARMPRLAASLLRADGVLAYRCQGFIDDHGRPAMRLLLNGQLPLRCDRCGREFIFELDVECRFFFVATEAELAAIEIDAGAEEVLLGSAQFDLDSLVEDEVILQLPLSPRHAACEPSAQVPVADFGAQRPKPFAQLLGLREELRGQAKAQGQPREAGMVPGTSRGKSRRSSG